MFDVQLSIHFFAQSYVLDAQICQRILLETPPSC